ncbi:MULTISPECIES: 6,7-dimethyl-8-ribityllumazine synthase [Acidiplasma]|jgi:6,7-dimethyl-8-ribityllumazine synthase|uniref:6,7-dimethyl-8-ribityllumazine synthase n=2 Tax=Acidiplasma TaxID=507753 RepID=A0A0Q0RPY4_9ARCH|nr:MULTISPECIES: 6,7-dimethyl-8-ribityllumazine synthase [Acidiplasma]KJE48703.1 6,7-dimethyl-8-ribityllumazine synthase [Acidiplasma sp. MBA-1]KPV46848.1 6,7-dimethyl-8-ribityllumazine synthase [Acidiplasma aeolicum]KQB34287.1 6,7-dimethyl-8-ribityllumazine synthase [Acidiplasma cupricumulans]KQB34733.1 6,7-dimethyl-8-ribityllumazine synthase [Acidiplasma aeolicum]WMT55478.1 MAG: 6,7-dimethyl-8-ribityllumazine synthase [Acidiplasma sp.]
MDKINIGIVVAEFNYDITMMMLQRAREYAEFLGVNVSRVFRVPGTFDMPLAIKKLLKLDDVDGVVTLGAVIKGETDHHRVIMDNAARKITDLSLEFEKPVALGISGSGESRLQAEARIEMAKDAVESCVKMIKSLRDLK